MMSVKLAFLFPFEHSIFEHNTVFCIETRGGVCVLNCFWTALKVWVGIYDVVSDQEKRVDFLYNLMKSWSFECFSYVSSANSLLDICYVFGKYIDIIYLLRLLKVPIHNSSGNLVWKFKSNDTPSNYISFHLNIMSSQDSLTLTYGIELEVVVGMTRSQYRSCRDAWLAQVAKHPSHIFISNKYSSLERVYFAMACLLQKAGIPTHDPTNPAAHIDHPHPGKDYSKWTVENDISITAQTPEAYREYEEKIKAIEAFLWAEYRRVEDTDEEVWRLEKGLWEKYLQGKKGQDLDVGKSEDLLAAGVANLSLQVGVPIKGPSNPEGKREKSNRKSLTYREILERLNKIIAVHASDAEASEDMAERADAVMDEGDPSEMLYFPMEIITRVLPYNEASAMEVKKALKAITAHVQLFTNASCGLNVHVGNSTNGFPLATLKKFAHLIVAFEHVIESVCSDTFLNGRDCRTYSKSPSESPRLIDVDLLTRLTRIKACPTLESLIVLMNPGCERYYAYNFLNLIPGQKTRTKENEPTRTIEMRQCNGTVDIDEILAFTDLTTGLLELAHNMTDIQIVTLCLQKGTDSSYTIVDLLWTIGREELIPFYEPRITVRPRREDPIDHNDEEQSEDDDSEVMEAVLDARDEHQRELRVMYDEASRLVVKDLDSSAADIIGRIRKRMAKAREKDTDDEGSRKRVMKSDLDRSEPRDSVEESGGGRMKFGNLQEEA